MDLNPAPGDSLFITLRPLSPPNIRMASGLFNRRQDTWRRAIAMVYQVNFAQKAKESLKKAGKKATLGLGASVTLAYSAHAGMSSGPDTAPPHSTRKSNSHGNEEKTCRQEGRCQAGRAETNQGRDEQVRAGRLPRWRD